MTHNSNNNVSFGELSGFFFAARNLLIGTGWFSYTLKDIIAPFMDEFDQQAV